ncbi:hypothetical protein [Rubinisphaera brasiliensis]|uniref:Uncharacterized protein n=1 Tax=Rubinisphaera brasiliensis (strain ATCC 49424 / DSM 5305 / JCM 21570 / IAM 15109 / NBRC 103401 / IFAM 1448) TaxID=756272 RepID=F0SRI0_RUBBR|nr:hypothetical protein [Rubinisphaera brasiliensis]ADY58041.1 hypothetical protein Plabr_0414 [Rubinisphaera brasiliensis DSM 5305]
MNDPVDLDTALAQVTLVPFNKDVSYWRIVKDGSDLSIEASRDGAIELAVHFLQLANAPHSEQIPLRWRDDSLEDEFQLNYLVRQDFVNTGEVAEQRPRSLTDRLFLWGCALISFVFAMVFVGGIIFWSQLIWADL